MHLMAVSQRPSIMGLYSRVDPETRIWVLVTGSDFRKCWGRSAKGKDKVRVHDAGGVRRLLEERWGQSTGRPQEMIENEHQRPCREGRQVGYVWTNSHLISTAHGLFCGPRERIRPHAVNLEISWPLLLQQANIFIDIRKNKQRGNGTQLT